jgi:peptidoglycan/LPS O-acetylase OafA/YrhL
MCYSLYLIHGPVTKVIAHLLCLAGVWEVWGTLLVTFPLCIAGAVAASWMFHLAIERRFLNTPAVMAYRLVEPRPAAAPPQTAALKP